MRSSMRTSDWQRITAALVITLTTFAARAEVKADHAANAEDPRGRAAALFEEGVRQFEKQDFTAAARTFLYVDELLPSARALSNALAAARRAGLHVIVAEAVERSRGRTDLEPEARKVFERAFADAVHNLARIEATCRPAPCTVAVDGLAVNAARYFEPGEHVAVASGQGRRAEQRLKCAAGATCAVEIALEPPPAAPAPAIAAPPPPADVPPPPRQKPLRPWVVVAGATVTAGLAAMTVWSGVDALSARDRHAPDSPAYDPDDVKSRALRTDLLLGGTALALGATAVVGLFFVDWNAKTRVSAGIAPGGGAFAAVAREF